MHHPERRAEIEQRGNDRRLDDLVIFDAEGLGHDEGHGTHDGRHDLAPHRRCRLDAAGKGSAVTEPFHQRNGELAGGDDICDTRSRDRAHQAGRDDRNLGGAAAGMADQAKRHVGEELDHARALKEGAEQDEQEDVRGRDIGRDAVDPLGAIGHVLDDLLEIVAAMGEHSGQIVAEQAVEQERAGDDRQGGSHDDPGGGEYRDQSNNADDEIEGQRKAGAQDQRGVLDPLVEGHAHACQAGRPGDRADRHRPSPHRGDERKGQQHEEADVEGTHDLARKVYEMGRDTDLVGREGDGDPEQDAALAARRKASVCWIMDRGAGLRRIAVRFDGGHVALRSKPACLISRGIPARDRPRRKGHAPEPLGLRAAPFPCSSARRRDAAGSEGPLRPFPR